MAADDPQMDASGLEEVYRKGLESSGNLEGMDLGHLKAEFCKVWPNVKTGLDLLRTISGLIPGLGAIVTSVIGIVIKAGDALYKALGCQPAAAGTPSASGAATGGSPA